MNSVPCPSCDCPESVSTIYLHQPAPTLHHPSECYHSREVKDIWDMESFVLCASNKPDAQDVTILTQLTMDRFNTLVELADRWQGPLSVALYLPKTEFHVSDVKRKYNMHESLKKFADIHIIHERDDSRYPINHLRNLVLKNARTQFVLMLDVDFIPNIVMHKQLREVTETMQEPTNKDVFVVAAFEAPGVNFPETKSGLLDLVRKKMAYQVHYFKGIHAHLPTNYEKWYEATEPYEIQYEYSYEPYFVIRRDLCPLYNERFVGYGNDKSSHVYELAAAGFRFLVHPDSFIIHKDHPSPPWRSDQGSDEAWKRWAQFTKDLQWKYGFKMDVPDWLKEACNNGDCPKFWL